MSSGLPMGEGPRRGPRPGLVAAAAMLVVIIAAGAFVALHHPAPAPAGTAGTPAPSPAAPGTGTGGTVQPDAGASASGGCRPRDTDQAIPAVPPSGVRWALFDTVALPSSPDAGPLRVAGEVATCYAHTPTGALLAAAQTCTRYLLADDWRAVVAASVVPDAGAAAYSAARARASTGPGVGGGGGYGQYAAYQYASYTGDVAVLQLVARFPSGAYQAVTVTVRWYRGDWRLQLLPDGAMSETAQHLGNLIGFVPWGGV